MFYTRTCIEERWCLLYESGCGSLTVIDLVEETSMFIEDSEVIEKVDELGLSTDLLDLLYDTGYSEIMNNERFKEDLNDYNTFGGQIL